MSDSAPSSKPVNESLRRKRSARIAAIQALYNREIIPTRQSVQAQAEQLIDQWRDSIAAQDEEWPSTDMPERSLLLTLLSGVIEYREALDAMLETVINENWKPERMGAVMMATLRCAIYELMYQPERKTAVIVDQYVSIAKDFFDEAELAYIHSALQRLASQVRPAA